jgi:acid phosphatase type 7
MKDLKINRVLHSAIIVVVLLFVNLSEAVAATGQYTLAFRNDPATSIVIGWSGDVGTVYYGTTDEGTDYTAYPLSHGVDRVGSAHGHNRKFARLTGLTPNTMYYFVIYDAAGQTSARYKFRTLSDNPNDPVSYITGGDSRDGFKLFGLYIENCPSGNCLDKRREGNILVSKIKPDFVAFNGDFVMNQLTSNTFNEWNQWLNDWQLTISSDGRMYPTMHTLGNHEDSQDNYHIFDVPQEEYYALNINGGLLRMYFLNSEINACTGTNQLMWLQNDFNIHSTGGASDPIWKFVQYHIATFSMGNGYGLVQSQMNCWVNLFEQFNVRMVSESHSHVTKWTYPCKANAAKTDFQPDPNGIVYIGEGQWGAPHRTLDFTGNNQKPYVRDQGVFDSFFFVKVNQSRTSIQCVKFENVNAVTENTHEHLGGDLPNNITIWSPANGDEIIIENTSLSTPDEGKADDIRLVPNPAVDEVVIHFPKVFNNTKVELYNSLGKLCSSELINAQSHKVDLTDACSGVNYIYITQENGEVLSFKIVKQ